jgi:hypothetical protein
MSISFWTLSKKFDEYWNLSDSFLRKDIVLSKNDENSIEEIEVSGFKYRVGSFLCINTNLEVKNDTFGKILQIKHVDNKTSFYLNTHNLDKFEKNKNVFLLSANKTNVLIGLENITHKRPLDLISYSGTVATVQIRYFFHDILLLRI